MNSENGHNHKSSFSINNTHDKTHRSEEHGNRPLPANYFASRSDNGHSQRPNSTPNISEKSHRNEEQSYRPLPLDFISKSNEYGSPKRNDSFKTPNKNNRNIRKNFRDDATFNCIDDDFINTEFDFEKNLALFDKQVKILHLLFFIAIHIFVITIVQSFTGHLIIIQN